MTRITGRAIGIKLGNIQIPISCGEVTIHRDREEVYSISSPVPFYVPTRETVEWRAEIFVTNELLQLEGTYWYDNLMQLITRSELIDYEVNLPGNVNISVCGPIGVEISEDFAQDLQIVRLRGEGVLQAGLGDDRFDRRVYTNSTFTDIALEETIHEQATELLCMFLESEQATEFKEKGHFDYIEENRTWRFIRRHHWPIELWVDGRLYKKLCLDIDPQAPTEDLLLWTYLQIKGGRSEGILKTAKGA